MYNDFFAEFVEKEAELMYKYYLEHEIFFEDGEGKEGVYKINYYFRDHIQTPLVTPKLKLEKYRDSIIEFVGKFMSDHDKELSTSGPVHFFSFGDAETQFLYDLFGITAEEIIKFYDEMIKETYYGKISKFFTGWVYNAPHKILITSMLIDGLQNNYEDIIECCEYLWPFCEYPMFYREYWKLGVREDFMNYTIEHLGSKYKVKKVHNLQELLKYDGHISVTSHAERLKTGADHTYMDFMQRMHSQINNTLKNISRAYFDNIEKNATQHNQVSQFDDGSLNDMEGHTTNIAQTVESTINKFARGDINNTIVKIAADGSDVDKGILTGYLNQIMSTKNNRLNNLVEDIITAFFNRNPQANSLDSSEFVVYGLALYRSISTSKDPLYQEIRQILDYWMFTIINIRQYYQREGTITNYTRAIFNYIIFMINYYN